MLNFTCYRSFLFINSIRYGLRNSSIYIVLQQFNAIPRQKISSSVIHQERSPTVSLISSKVLSIFEFSMSTSFLLRQYIF